MTWRDFVNSKYNIKNWAVLNGDKIKYKKGFDVSSKNGLVKPSDLIINECEYFTIGTDPT